MYMYTHTCKCIIKVKCAEHVHTSCPCFFGKASLSVVELVTLLLTGSALALPMELLCKEESKATESLMTAIE